MPVATIDPVYTADVTVTGGRGGHATSSDGALDINLCPPGAKAQDPGTNPEQLFAAGYAACFQSAMFGAAKQAGLHPDDITVRSEVSLGKSGDEAWGLAVRLTVIVPGADLTTIDEIAQAAHARCPYSRATRGNIEVEIVAEN